MRRILVVPMMLACLLCTCCGRENSQMRDALKFREKQLGAGSCSFTAEIEADFGEKLHAFTLDCRYEDGAAQLTVTAPETLAGICAAVTDDSANLEFEGLALDYGTLANGNVAPLAAPWIWASAWERDYILSCGKDGEYLRVTILKGYNEEELTIDTWLKGEIPVFAEISHDGRRVLSMTLQDFTRK